MKRTLEALTASNGRLLTRLNIVDVRACVRLCVRGRRKKAPVCKTREKREPDNMGSALYSVVVAGVGWKVAQWVWAGFGWGSAGL